MSQVVKVYQPSGILDCTKAGSFHQEITKLVESNVDIVLIDCQDITFMDSAGLGAFVLALKTVRSAGGRLCICSVRDHMKMLFELTSFDLIFEIFQNREAFENALAGS